MCFEGFIAAIFSIVPLPVKPTSDGVCISMIEVFDTEIRDFNSLVSSFNNLRYAWRGIFAFRTTAGPVNRTGLRQSSFS